MINKRGQTLQGWSEGIIFIVLFVIVFGVVIVSMNSLYDKEYTVAGLETSGIENALESYQAGVEEKYRGGEASFLSQVGLTLKTSWDIIFSTMNLIWGFLTGGWIQTIATDYMRLPQVVGFMLRTIYFLSVGFIVLRILFKVKA